GSPMRGLRRGGVAAALVIAIPVQKNGSPMRGLRLGQVLLRQQHLSICSEERFPDEGIETQAIPRSLFQPVRRSEERFPDEGIENVRIAFTSVCIIASSEERFPDEGIETYSRGLRARPRSRFRRTVPR